MIKKETPKEQQMKNISCMSVYYYYYYSVLQVQHTYVSVQKKKDVWSER